MKIELKSREGSVYKKLCSSVSEANSDTELIVPDSLEASPPNSSPAS